MAIIRDIEQIRDLIPTFEDLKRCGNFASVKEEIIKKNALYAFAINGSDEISVKSYNVKFLLLGLTHTYSLVLVSDTDKIGRFCDFMTVLRDVTKPMKIEDWKWSLDEIGISIRSDNASRNFIYFGTDSNDVDEIKKGLHNKLRKETEYKKIEPKFINSVMESLKKGKPIYVSTDEKRKDVTFKSPPPPLTTIIGEQKKGVLNTDSNHTLEVLNRYAQMRYGKGLDEPKDTIITTETVYI